MDLEFLQSMDVQILSAVAVAVLAIVLGAIFLFSSKKSKVVLDNGLAVAVRRLGDGGGQRLKEFQTEVEAIGKMRHQNIVNLRAYCCSDEEKLLIYDYMSNGDLAAAIHENAWNNPNCF